MRRWSGLVLSTSLLLFSACDSWSRQELELLDFSGSARDLRLGDLARVGPDLRSVDPSPDGGATVEDAGIDQASPTPDAAPPADGAAIDAPPPEDLPAVDAPPPPDLARGDLPPPDLGPCVDGGSCQPLLPCRIGVVICRGGGSSFCVDTMVTKGNGASCGADRYCYSGVCNSCVGGMACTPPVACHVGATSCATGTSVCTDTKVNAPDGKACGKDQVCLAGVCGFCGADQPCDPSGNPCRLGKTDCSMGKAACKDLGQAPNGTACGVDKVCKDGNCTTCKAGAACMGADPCLTAVIKCATGAPVCTPDKPRPDGTDCGMNLFCVAGKCVQCNHGATCKPKDPCHLGAIDCSGGMAVCNDTNKAVVDGTGCGNKLYCQAGVCGACDPGAKCATNMGCSSGVVSCDSGRPVCQPGGAAPDGSPCLDDKGMPLKDQVCTFGLCVPCKKDAACVPDNPCHVGRIDCTKGPVCLDTNANLPDGSDCGFGKRCQGGACK